MRDCRSCYLVAVYEVLPLALALVGGASVPALPETRGDGLPHRLGAAARGVGLPLHLPARHDELPRLLRAPRRHSLIPPSRSPSAGLHHSAAAAASEARRARRQQSLTTGGDPRRGATAAWDCWPQALPFPRFLASICLLASLFFLLLAAACLSLSLPAITFLPIHTARSQSGGPAAFTLAVSLTLVSVSFFLFFFRHKNGN